MSLGTNYIHRLLNHAKKVHICNCTNVDKDNCRPVCDLLLFGFFLGCWANRLTSRAI